MQECCDLGSRRTCENSYHVLSATGADSSTVLDGFTVVGAYASFARDGGNPRGAGIWCDPCALTIRDSRFLDNSEAGIYARHGSNITLLDSSFDPSLGCSVEAWQSDVTVTGCTFNDNKCALFVWGGDAIVQHCSFARCHLPLYVEGNATVAFSTFENGGDVDLTSGRSTVTDCRFVGNSTHMYINDSAAVVENSAFLGSTNGTVYVGGAASCFATARSSTTPHGQRPSHLVAGTCTS
jgi:hypothetical protein